MSSNIYTETRSGQSVVVAAAYVNIMFKSRMGRFGPKYITPVCLFTCLKVSPPLIKAVRVCHLLGGEVFLHPLKTKCAASTCGGSRRAASEHPSPSPDSGGRFEDERERWERRRQGRRGRRLRQRSVSREKWVETLVVADAKMVQHHGSRAVESYVLAVMNIVSISINAV